MYHPTHVYKRKNFPDKRECRGPLGPPLNPPLVFNNLIIVALYHNSQCPYTCGVRL